MKLSPDELRHEKKYFWSFIWAAIIAADLIAVSFFMAGDRNMKRYIENNYNSKIIQDFTYAKESADISMIMLGNSRLRHAVTFGFDPQKIIIMPDGRKLAALQFSYNAGRFDLYEDLTWPILNAHPDLIVIQNSIISNAPPPGMAGAVKISRIVLDYFRKILTDYDERQEWMDDRNMVLSHCDFTFDASHMAQRVSFMEKDQHSLTDSNAGYMMARRFIAQAQARGIKIVVLNIRPRTGLLKKFNIPLHITDFHGLGFYPEPKQLLPDFYDDVIWATYEDPTEESHYCDEVHLNAQGREEFTTWFSNKIVRDWLP